MPISHQYKCVFVHIPKNGGSTIEDYLDIKGKDRDIEMKITFNGVNAAWRHLPAPTIREIYPEIYSEYYKFTFVRNPYDRVVSEYFWQNRSNPDLLNNSEEVLVKKFTSWMYATYKNQSSHKTCQQYRFLYDLDGNFMVDQVFRFENFKTEIKKLLSKLEIKNKENIHANKSRHIIDKNLLLNEKNKKFIFQKFELDFKLFGYSEKYFWIKK